MEDINKVKSEIKSNISLLIEKGNIDSAKDLINEYENIVSNDIDIYSTKAVISMIKRNYEEAERILNEGLKINSSNVDLNYNLGYLYEQQGQIHKALEYYKNAKKYSNDINLRNEIDNIISRIEGKELKDRKRIVFFSKGDDKFIWDIINELSKEYETKKITVTKTEELKLIDKWMDWADICWFEWCDELVTYGSGLEIARNKKIICRLHSYEAFTNHINNVQWENVDRVLFVAEHIRSFVLEQIKNIEKSKTIVIPNGININKYKFTKRKPGFNIAYVGYINYKKGPMLLLHMFKKLYDKDNRYKLYIAGKYQDWRYLLYFKQMIKEMGLENNVFYDGWQENIDEWLENKNYIVSTSVLESQHLSIMEAMTKGIKPIIHNFVGAKDIYSHKYIWNTIDEAVEMVLSNKYDSEEYREYIENNYSSEEQIKKIKSIINNMISNVLTMDSNIYQFSYKRYRINIYLPNLQDHIQLIIYKTRNFYEINMLEDIKNRIKEDSIIIDVGANIGNHTIFFAKVCKAKKVYSFEPQSEVYNILKKNVQINNISDIVDTIKMGVGNKKTKGQLIIENKNNLGMGKLTLSSNGEIEINSIDNIFINKNTKIDLIKIDVEGMELDVLEGAEEVIKKHRPLLYVEASTREQYDSVFDYLKDFGYKPLAKFNATPTYLFAIE